MRISFQEGDLLDQDVEAIVNAWNRNIIRWWLLLPQGVSGAIKRRARYEPFESWPAKRLPATLPLHAFLDCRDGSWAMDAAISTAEHPAHAT